METSQNRLQLCYREETQTDLLSGREVVLAGSVSGPVLSSASRDSTTETPTMLREETQTDLLSGWEAELAGTHSGHVWNSASRDSTTETPTMLPRGDPD